MEGVYSAGEVSRLAGFAKPWMLGHLEREKIFVREHDDGRHHGRKRAYTFADLLILRAINRMLDIGMRPVRIRDVIEQIRQIKALTSQREAAEVIVKTVGIRLFVTKTTAHLVMNEDEIVSLTQEGQLAFAFMVDLKGILADVIDIAKAYEKRRRRNWKVDEALLDEMCGLAGI